MPPMSATLARQGIGRVDLRFRESDLAQQLVKARVAACGQGSPPGRGRGGGPGEGQKAEAAAEARRRAEWGLKPGKKAKPPGSEPVGKAQRNFTDPDSRVPLTRDGFPLSKSTTPRLRLPTRLEQELVLADLAQSHAPQAQPRPAVFSSTRSARIASTSGSGCSTSENSWRLREFRTLALFTVIGFAHLSQHINSAP
jgi:hypothetical protein